MEGLVIALAAAVAAALASTAGAGSTAAAKTQAVSCKSTLKIGFTAPFTGGAGFLGNEQLSWAKYAVKTLAPKYGLKIKLVTGDTPVEQGPAIAQTIAQKFIADKTVVAVIGPSTSGNVAASSQAFFAGRSRPHLAVGDAHVADEGRDEGGDGGVLPRRPGRLHPGPDGRELHDQAGCQERRRCSTSRSRTRRASPTRPRSS